MSSKRRSAATRNAFFRTPYVPPSCASDCRGITVAMLEYRAEQEATTISGVLAKELDGIASAHAEELSAVIPGFAAALAWPDVEAAQLPC